MTCIAGTPMGAAATAGSVRVSVGRDRCRRRDRGGGEALRLGEPYGRWLLIFDDADRLEDIEDLIPHGAARHAQVAG